MWRKSHVLLCWSVSGEWCVVMFIYSMASSTLDLKSIRNLVNAPHEFSPNLEEAKVEFVAYGTKPYQYMFIPKHTKRFPLILYFLMKKKFLMFILLN